MFEKIRSKIRRRYILLFVLSLIFLWIWYSINPIMSYFEKREIKEISSILANPLKEKTMDDCKSIMNFDTKKVSKWNTHFNTITFDTIYNECSLKYDLKNFTFVIVFGVL